MPVIPGDHCCMRLIFAMLARLKFLDRTVEDFALRFHALTIARVEMFGQSSRSFPVSGIE